MSQLDLAIILSTTRSNRFADAPARLVLDAAEARDDLRARILDLRDYPLPLFEEAASPAWAPSEDEVARRWQRDVARFDAYVFVVAEYNRGIPAALKNALDYSYREWNRKPAGYVGYGSVGAARSIEQLRLVNVEQQMAPMRSGVHIQGAEFFRAGKGDVDLTDLAHVRKGIDGMLDELAWWGHALKRARVAAGAKPERAAA